MYLRLGHLGGFPAPGPSALACLAFPLPLSLALLGFSFLAFGARPLSLLLTWAFCFGVSRGSNPAQGLVPLSRFFALVPSWLSAVLIYSVSAVSIYLFLFLAKRFDFDSVLTGCSVLAICGSSSPSCVVFSSRDPFVSEPSFLFSVKPRIASVLTSCGAFWTMCYLPHAVLTTHFAFSAGCLAVVVVG